MRPAAKRVLVAPSSFCDVDRLPISRLEGEGWEVIRNPYGRKLTKAELVALLPDVTGIIAGLEPLTRDVLEKSQLRVISRCGAGLSNVDLDAAQSMGIKVRSTPDAPTVAVAELTVGVLIALLRKVAPMDRDMHVGRWNKQIGVQLAGKTVVIVGIGRIGRKVAGLLRPFDVKLCAVDPALAGTVEGIPILPLDQAIRQADVICLHAGGEEEILGAKEFARMKRGVFLLNAGRGGLVDESALCAAMQSGTVAGAWIDTFSREPYQGPLASLDQALLTPHIGSLTVECRRRMELESVDNLLDAFAELASRS